MNSFALQVTPLIILVKVYAVVINIGATAISASHCSDGKGQTPYIPITWLTSLVKKLIGRLSSIKYS